MKPVPPAFRADMAWQIVCWAGAVAGMLAAFGHDWPLPLLGMDLRTRPGHVLIELQEVVKAALLGSFLGGAWWAVVREGKRSGSLAILVWSSLALAGKLSAMVFWGGLGIWLLRGLYSMLVYRRELWPVAWGFHRRPAAWNGAFCLLWIVIGTACDAALLRDAPPGWLSAADALLARFFTHAIIALGVWWMLAVHDRLAPAPGRWLAWLVVIATPLLIVVNTWLQLWWGKGMIEMFGELEVGGRFELERIWAAGGVELNAQTVLSLVGVLLAAGGLFALCGWFSQKRGWQVSPMRLAVWAAVAWLGLQVDQLAGIGLKDRGWRWWERKTYHRRMTWIEPAPGLRGYEVAFRNPKPVSRPQQLAARPDVFLFMVESLRADALKPEIAPFLCRFRDEECQRLGETWAASNVTHQSWFSILSGRLPLFFAEARHEQKMLPLPAVLKASGYRVETRMVNDFSYMEMVATNFGNPGEADVMEHVDRDSPENFFKVPEREVRMLRRLKYSVQNRAAGGLLAITGMDSTHYNYKWGTSFTPPFADYEENPMFPMRPNPEQVRRIVNRFWNSVSWVDAQLAEFITWLKAQGRYDDAIIIITGDHGEEFKEQGSWFHGTMLNESQTRVPILIKWPKKASQGRGPEVARASHLDLLPTLFDALGCEPALWKDLPGISLLHPPAGERTLVMTTHFCGKNGEALLLRRGPSEAGFGWHDFWQPIVPSTMWLERVKQVPMHELGHHFDDLMPRIFERLVPDDGMKP